VNIRKLLVIAFLGTVAPVGAYAQPSDAPPPLPAEVIPNVETLPSSYPASWIMVHDFNFNALIDGRGVVVDTSSPHRPVKGTVQIAQFGNVLLPSGKPEIYTTGTYYSRLTRGERTDVLTIWDKSTLLPKDEIILPGGKRQQQVTYKNTFQFTNNEKWALVANFTPAQSVTVVDLENRKILADIDLPGCTMIYPTGERGFSTFCADGTVSTLLLADDGTLASIETTEPILNVDEQPLFAMPAMVGKTAWFVSYYGQLQGFDFSGPIAEPIEGTFPVGTAEGGTPEWRPGGWQVIASDAAGRLYVLMSPDGTEGSHKGGGTEVWVVDPATKTRVARIPVQGVAVSIDVTREDAPHLVVARADSTVDIYDANTGEFVRTLGNVAFNPQTLSVFN
jgi:methylamine dehydrogenase heavy chain